jgi:hypothetical protein
MDPLHVVAARLRPQAPADDDGDWAAAIARAKKMAASPRDEWAAMAPTPPPKTPRPMRPGTAPATLDAFLARSAKRP